MIEMIKEIGIFIVIAQALLYFVPGQSYAKYVKAVIGIVMIAKLADPVLSLFTDNTTDRVLEEAMKQSYSFLDQQESGMFESAKDRGQTMLLSAIEEELKQKLKESSLNGYEVKNVLVKSNDSGEVQGIAITVCTSMEEREKIRIEKVTAGQEKKKKLTKDEEEELKKYYGMILEIPPEQIEICLQQ